MSQARKLLAIMAFAIVAGSTAPASATTLVRQSLENLVADNGVIVVGEVIGKHSYWNEGGTFILTDLTIETREVLKGKVAASEITVTIPGGTVGDLSTLIVDGAELAEGRSYVLFLDRKSFLGVKDVLTVDDHAQGVFEVVQDKGKGGLRAVSQASKTRLVPDVFGESAAPGKAEGLAFDKMKQSVREIAGRAQSPRQEVK